MEFLDNIQKEFMLGSTSVGRVLALLAQSAVFNSQHSINKTRWEKHCNLITLEVEEGRCLSFGYIRFKASFGC